MSLPSTKKYRRGRDKAYFKSLELDERRFQGIILNMPQWKRTQTSLTWDMRLFVIFYQCTKTLSDKEDVVYFVLFSARINTVEPVSSGHPRVMA